MFSPDGTLISASAAPHCGVRRMELSRRNVKVKKVGEVGGGPIREDFRAQYRKFVLESLLSRKPVKS